MNNQDQKLKKWAADNGLPIKPVIKLPGGNVQNIDTARELYKVAGAGGKLVFSNGLVMKLQQGSHGARYQLVLLSPSKAVTEFESYAMFSRHDGKSGQMTESIAKIILSADVARELLPNVRLVLSRPMLMLVNGQIETTSVGYNAQSQVLVADGKLLEPETLEDAVEFILSILDEFSFKTESDKSRAVASLLTPAMSMGGFIKGAVPIDVIEADKSQTGKGYFLRLRELCFGEESILIAQQRGGTGSLDESLGSAILSGKPFIQIDNFRGRLNSPFLEAFITNWGSLNVRVPYAASQTVNGANRYIAITSNGMELTEDLANRASFVRLVKEDGRVFTEVHGKPMHQHVAECQPAVAGSIAKVIREYVSLGMPKTQENRHDRTEWAQKMDWIVQNIFKLPPLMDGMEEVKVRSTNPALTFVRELAIQVQKSDKLGQELKPSDLAEVCALAGMTIPGLEKKPDGGYSKEHEFQRVGQLMRQAMNGQSDLVVEGFRITHDERKRRLPGGNIYTGNHYRFEMMDPPRESGAGDPQQTSIEPVG